MVDELIEECTDKKEEVKIAEMDLFVHGDGRVYPYAISVILAVIALTISIGIGAYFA